MTSLQIAEIGDKRHTDLMRTIRNMEPAWERVNGRKFALVDYIDAKGEKRPCYNLTKEECLYIATKFNDEARARLVLRWMELERQQMQRAAESIINTPALEDWRWHDVPSVKAVFTYLLENALKDNGTMRGIDLKRGQIVTTPESIGTHVGLKRSAVRNQFVRLVDSGDIAVVATNKYTLITILTFDRFTF